jgi:hypothetical protein
MSTSPQERTRKAREAFASCFNSPAEKSEYYRQLGKKRTGAVVLSAEEAEALSSVYGILRRVAERTRKNGGGANA